MKSKIIIITVIYLSIVQFISAQVTPIETIVESNKTVYKTASYNSNSALVKGQPYDLQIKIQDNIKIEDNSDNPLLVKNCLNASTYSSLRTNKVYCFIKYIFDQNGNVLSCSLTNYKNLVTISSSEVQCILTEALNNKFNISNLPSDVGAFKYTVGKLIKFK